MDETKKAPDLDAAMQGLQLLWQVTQQGAFPLQVHGDCQRARETVLAYIQGTAVPPTRPE